jgi:RecA-family ATPase
VPFKLPKVIQLAALLTEQLPKARPLVYPWLSSGESCLLWASTGAGKSMIAQTLALAVAGGGSVFGWTFPNPSRVLYVDGEQSPRALQSRFRLLSSAIQGHNADSAADNLTVMARAKQPNPGEFLDVSSVAQHRAFINYVKREGFALVVFDNLSTLSDSIEDENSAAAMKPMQALLTHLKRVNVAVILVHHSGRDPTRYRGSSALATTFERILAVLKNERAPATRIDVTVQLEKFRDEVPEGFRPSFPLAFSTEEAPRGGRRAVWTVGTNSLEEAWREFASGSHETTAAFVEWFNERFSAKHAPGNFGRDFEKRFLAELGKSPREVREARSRMRMLRQVSESTDIGQGF